MGKNRLTPEKLLLSIRNIPLVDLLIFYDHVINERSYAGIGEKLGWSHEYVRLRFLETVNILRELMDDKD